MLELVGGRGQIACDDRPVSSAPRLWSCCLTPQGARSISRAIECITDHTSVRMGPNEPRVEKSISRSRNIWVSPGSYKTREEVSPHRTLH